MSHSLISFLTVSKHTTDYAVFLWDRTVL